MLHGCTDLSSYGNMKSLLREVKAIGFLIKHVLSACV